MAEGGGRGGRLDQGRGAIWDEVEGNVILAKKRCHLLLAREVGEDAAAGQEGEDSDIAPGHFVLPPGCERERPLRNRPVIRWHLPRTCSIASTRTAAFLARSKSIVVDCAGRREGDPGDP